MFVLLRKGEKMVCKSFCIGVLAAALSVNPVFAAQGIAPASATQDKSPASLADSKAQLSSINGKVLVNQGAGFLQPSPGVFLNTGDKIFVGHEASAVITYVADDCQVVVNADRVTTIEVLSPCQKEGLQIQPAADLPIPEEAQAHVAAFPWPLLLVPPIVACVIFCFKDDDKKHTPD